MREESVGIGIFETIKNVLETCLALRSIILHFLSDNLAVMFADDTYRRSFEKAKGS